MQEQKKRPSGPSAPEQETTTKTKVEPPDTSELETKLKEAETAATKKRRPCCCC